MSNLNKARQINTRILIRSDRYMGGWDSTQEPLLEGEVGFAVDSTQNKGILKIGAGPNITGYPNIPSQNTWSAVEQGESDPSNYLFTFYSGKGAGYELRKASSTVLGGVLVGTGLGSTNPSNGITINEHGLLKMDYSDIGGPEFKFTETVTNSRSLRIASSGITITGPLYANNIISTGSIVAESVTAAEIISSYKTTEEYLTLRYNKETSPNDLASGLVLHNLIGMGQDGIIELRKEDKSVWAGPTNELRRIPYVESQGGSIRTVEAVTYDSGSNVLKPSNLDFTIEFYSEHGAGNEMPVNFNTGMWDENLSYKQTFSNTNNFRFRIPTLLTDFSDLVEVGAVSTTEKDKWHGAVQNIEEVPSLNIAFVDRSGAYINSPTIKIPPIPRPGTYLPSNCTINGIPITANTQIPTGTVYTAGNDAIVINSSTISHKKPVNIIKISGTFILNDGNTFTVVEGITVDEYGHVTSITSKTYKVSIASSGSGSSGSGGTGGPTGPGGGGDIPEPW